MAVTIWGDLRQQRLSMNATLATRLTCSANRPAAPLPSLRNTYTRALHTNTLTFFCFSFFCCASRGTDSCSYPSATRVEAREREREGESRVVVGKDTAGVPGCRLYLENEMGGRMMPAATLVLHCRCNRVRPWKLHDMYYGCEVGNHCASGNMKIAVKTIPDYTDRKHKGFSCDGQPTMIKRWTGRKKLKKCRSMCNKMEGCVAFEYFFRHRRSRCKPHAASEIPIKGEASGRAACWIGRNDCNVGQISF